MKKTILTIATLACFTLVGVATVHAKPERHANPMQMFSKLNLSDQQKQDMRDIFKTTRENNSVFDVEKTQTMKQIRDLMNMPTWDQASAETVIRAVIARSSDINLNRAVARNKVYNLLTEEQKATFADKGVKKGNKSKRKGKHQKMNMKRLTKALKLTNEQAEQFKTIQASTKAQMQNLKEQGKAHHETMKTIIQSSSFDENAWLAAHSDALDDMVAMKLIQTKARYDRISLLSVEQKQKFAKIMKKMKRGKRDNKRMENGKRLKEAQT